MNKNAPKVLYKDVIFVCAVFFPLASALIVAVWIFCNSQTSSEYMDFSVHGQDFILKSYRMPLAILWLLIPSISVAVYLHQSKISLHQISIASSQNRYANWLTHRKEFSERLAFLEEKYGVEFYDAAGLYRKVFLANVLEKRDMLNGDREIYI